MIKKLLFVSVAASGIGLYMSKGKIEYKLFDSKIRRHIPKPIFLRLQNSK
jgi:hypothetical protein